MDNKEELERLLAKQREEAYTHMKYEEELALYRKIQAGEYRIEDRPKDKAYPGPNMGKLSDIPLKNAKYHLVILTAMITRFCIEGGLDPEKAYTLSDIYIREVDAMKDISKVMDHFSRITMGFTGYMRELKNQKKYSKVINEAMEYINEHAAEPIRNHNVAEAIGRSGNYLNHLFHKEIGMSVTAYITKVKCDAAAYMLENSDVSCTEIAQFLGFATGSYFANRFKEYKGLSPSEYRKKNYRNALSKMGENKQNERI